MSELALRSRAAEPRGDVVTDATGEAAARAGFRALFDAHEAYVVRSLRRLGLPERDVEDLAHDVFLAVYQNLAKLDPNRPVRPWLFAFCFRFAANYRRGRGRVEPSEMEEVAAEQPDAEELVLREQRRTLVLHALETIALDRRGVFILHMIDGVPVPEVAEALGVPLGTAYTRLRAAKTDFERAVSRLRREAGEEA